MNVPIKVIATRIDAKGVTFAQVEGCPRKSKNAEISEALKILMKEIL